MLKTLINEKLLLAVGVKGAKYMDVKASDLTSTIHYLFSVVDKSLIKVNDDYFSLTDYSFPAFVNEIINLGFITLTSSTKTNLVLPQKIEDGKVLTPTEVEAIFKDLNSLGCAVTTEQFKWSHKTVSDLSIIPVLIDEERRAFIGGGAIARDNIYISEICLNLSEIADETVPIKVLL